MTAVILLLLGGPQWRQVVLAASSERDRGSARRRGGAAHILRRSRCICIRHSGRSSAVRTRVCRHENTEYSKPSENGFFRTSITPVADVVSTIKSVPLLSA